MPTTAASDIYKQGLIAFAAQHAPDYLATLAFNRDSALSIDWAEGALLHFAAQLDRHFLGNRWAAFPAELRTRFIAIPEGRRVGAGYLDLHYHALLSLAPCVKSASPVAELRDLAGRFWKKAVSSGDVDLQILSSADDHWRAASYICKRVCGFNSVGLERFVIGPPHRKAA